MTSFICQPIYIPKTNTVSPHSSELNLSDLRIVNPLKDTEYRYLVRNAYMVACYSVDTYC